jgi:cytochrome c oxidase accessory protein FixG
MSLIGKMKPQASVPDGEAPGPMYANRVRVYPMSVAGPMRRIKWAVLLACLGIYYLLPWLRWGRREGVPDQAVLLDLAHRRFYFFGLEFWPQDITFLAGLLILSAVGLFLVTSVAGRLWCGYACPQTVWTDLFMWVERRIEGDRNERMKRDSRPVTFGTAWRKVAKHGIWMAIAFWTGGAWIMYFVDAPTVSREFWTGEAAAPVYAFTFLFTGTTYLLAGWAREQVCTYMCPWPRFQAAMMDENTLSVTDRAWRGEPRTRGKQVPDGKTVGDCIDCGVCVAVCPTGVDIRDGLQLECINCGLCMDACNNVMTKLGRKRGLITWDTLVDQAAKATGKTVRPRFFRPRSLVYMAAVLVALVVMGAAMATRHTLSISVQRDRAPLFVTLADGQIRNGYLLRILNKTQAAGGYELRVGHLPGARIAIAESNVAPGASVILPVGADEIATFRVLVTATPRHLEHGSEKIEFLLRDIGTGDEAHYDSVFMGPVGFKPGDDD